MLYFVIYICISQGRWILKVALRMISNHYNLFIQLRLNIMICFLFGRKRSAEFLIHVIILINFLTLIWLRKSFVRLYISFLWLFQRKIQIIFVIIVLIITAIQICKVRLLHSILIQLVTLIKYKLSRKNICAVRDHFYLIRLLQIFILIHYILYFICKKSN